MKKVLLFLAVIVILFAGVTFLNKMQQEKKVEGNQYGKDTLRTETVAQLDDPNYQNIITPDELEKRIDNQENVTVYFYSPTCSYCQQTTPIVAPLAEEMEIDLVQLNLLEFEDAWKRYNIEKTPTIVQYKDGKEVERIIGYQEEEVFQQWFNTFSK